MGKKAKRKDLNSHQNFNEAFCLEALFNCDSKFCLRHNIMIIIIIIYLKLNV